MCTRINSHTDILLSALLYYDYLLTLSDEIMFFWGRKRGLITSLFFFNRYVPLVGVLFYPVHNLISLTGNVSFRCHVLILIDLFIELIPYSSAYYIEQEQVYQVDTRVLDVKFWSRLIQRSYWRLSLYQPVSIFEINGGIICLCFDASYPRHPNIRRL